tara:strand:- start:63 stop:452 length:390 start_codon:yes stop_codon:yes gene_type:complete
MNKIEIYTNENCPYCKQVKEVLNKNNINFEEKYTTKYESEWNDVVNLTGMPTVPTILYKEEYFVAGRDFPNPEYIVNAIKNFKKSKNNNNKIILQRIKTMNFHMNNAFGRLDQLLRQIENKLNIDEQKK